MEDLHYLVKMNHANPEALLVLNHNSRPSAICRLEISRDRKTLFLNDLHFNTNSNGTLLVDYVLEYARKDNFKQIISWVSDHSAKTSELLGSFTFEPRAVHLNLRYVILYAPEPSQVKLNPIKAQKLSIVQVHSKRVSSISLRDIFRHHRLSWIPVVQCVIKPKSEMIAYRSEKLKHLGFIRFDETFTGNPDTLLHCINGISSYLYESGVREIRTEVDSHQMMKQAFLRAGFGVDTTLFQLELDIMY
jgi:hypothetical protein